MRVVAWGRLDCMEVVRSHACMLGLGGSWGEERAANTTAPNLSSSMHAGSCSPTHTPEDEARIRAEPSVVTQYPTKGFSKNGLSSCCTPCAACGVPQRELRTSSSKAAAAGQAEDGISALKERRGRLRGDLGAGAEIAPRSALCARATAESICCCGCCCGCRRCMSASAGCEWMRDLWWDGSAAAAAAATAAAAEAAAAEAAAAASASCSSGWSASAAASASPIQRPRFTGAAALPSLVTTLCAAAAVRAARCASQPARVSSSAAARRRRDWLSSVSCPTSVRLAATSPRRVLSCG